MSFVVGKRGCRSNGFDWLECFKLCLTSVQNLSGQAWNRIEILSEVETINRKRSNYLRQKKSNKLVGFARRYSMNLASKNP